MASHEEGPGTEYDNDMMMHDTVDQSAFASLLDIDPLFESQFVDWSLNYDSAIEHGMPNIHYKGIEVQSPTADGTSSEINAHSTPEFASDPPTDTFPAQYHGTWDPDCNFRENYLQEDHQTFDPSTSDGPNNNDSGPALEFEEPPQWLNETYRPAVPCAYCRRRRLQCLVLRTSPVNPNPIQSCTSCVSLYVACSFAQGEKRAPYEFETAEPTSGNLHGITEEPGHDLSEGIPIPMPSRNPQRLDSGKLASAVSNRASFQLRDEVPSASGTAKNSSRFPRKTAKVLKSWLASHKDFPYPSDEEKVELEVETGLSRSQISNWFTNARRRGSFNQESRRSSGGSQDFGDRSSADRAGMNPLERWQNSPPEHEPVPPALVAEAIANSAPSAYNTDPWAAAYDGDFMDLVYNAQPSGHATPSVISEGTSRSSFSDHSTTTIWSHQSHASERKRRRRSRVTVNKDGNTINAQFACTFCGKTFKKKYDWQRHEKSIHLPVESWMCTTTGLVPEAKSGIPYCVFCSERNPTAEHLEIHDLEACVSRPLTERLFIRKDHLRQHLRKFHKSLDRDDWIVDSLKITNDQLSSRCGFCGCTFASWTERSDHIAEHFKSGSRMTQWIGDWGFDAIVEQRLRDAILPEIMTLVDRTQPEGG
jgi:hypothetical protein